MKRLSELKALGTRCVLKTNLKKWSWRQSHYLLCQFTFRRKQKQHNHLKAKTQAAYKHSSDLQTLA